jgi:sucrose-6-phosphate hydrolase SacC (GH32 family)
MATYELCEKMVADRHRPRYRFCPPEGRWNDLNGMVYWNGGYPIRKWEIDATTPW